jgi:hypothetical protein
MRAIRRAIRKTVRRAIRKTVLNVHEGAYFGRLSKIVSKGADSHINSGINQQRRFVRL